jgi:hypothetical protein
VACAWDGRRAPGRKCVRMPRGLPLVLMPVVMSFERENFGVCSFYRTSYWTYFRFEAGPQFRPCSRTCPCPVPVPVPLYYALNQRPTQRAARCVVAPGPHKPQATRGLERGQPRGGRRGVAVLRIVRMHGGAKSMRVVVFCFYLFGSHSPLVKSGRAVLVAPAELTPAWRSTA